MMTAMHTEAYKSLRNCNEKQIDVEKSYITYKTIFQSLQMIMSETKTVEKTLEDERKWQKGRIFPVNALHQQLSAFCFHFH